MARRRGTLDEPILDAATELFLQDGYAGTHMARVAEAADVSLATLYRYFESKEGLLDRAFRRESAKIENRWRDEAWVDPCDPDALLQYSIVIRGHTLDWAEGDRALGLLLTMAETPGLLYRFLLDQVEVYEHWIGHSLATHIEDDRFVTAHAVMSATGLFSIMIRWARGRFKEGKPDLPRQVPESVPDAERTVHVPRSCDFTAEELADWYTEMRLRQYGFPEATIDNIMADGRARDWRMLSEAPV